MSTYKLIIKRILNFNNNIFQPNYISDNIDNFCKLYFFSLLKNEINVQTKYKFFYNTIHNFVTNKNDVVKNEMGFPYAIHSILFVSANIPKSGIDTPSVNLLVKDSKLEQFLGNSNILANIPLNHISGSSTNEEFSHYKVPHINHNIIRNPVTEHTLILQLVKSDGITNHDLTGKHYSITIELIVDQGIQVS